MGPRLVTSDKFPGDADVAGVKAILCVRRAETLCEAKPVGRMKAKSFWSASHRWQGTVWAPKLIGF